MGLGDSMASGWGQPPANGPSWGSSPGNSNSNTGWTSSSTSSTNTTNHWGNNGHQTNGETITESSSLHSAYPKPSWAQAVCINRGPNQTQVPNYSGNCSNSNRSHLENSSDPKYPTSSEHEVKHHHDSSRLPTEVLVADNWGHAVSLRHTPAYQV